MVSSRKPRCFVAMAFDRDDTDGLYEESISPVLRSNGVTPVIINRREDNRDINHQIIEQLNACDFCIADLTYTRPSVYFEAGYAQRAVQVIYTVRADHLHQNQPDDLRVHFDLQMKPLISWTKPDDEKFRTKLERRLRRTVISEWKRAEASREKEQSERANFSHMSLAERLQKLRGDALTLFNKLGFKSWTPLLSQIFSDAKEMSYQQMMTYLNVYSWMTSRQRRRRLLDVISLRVEESLTLKQLRDEFGYRFVSSHYPPHLEGMRMIEERSPISKVVEHHVLCSIKPIPRDRIVSAMPSLRWESAASCYTKETGWNYKGTKWYKTRRGRDHTEVEISVHRSINIHVIDNIRSLPEFRQSLVAVIEGIGSNPQRHAQRRV